MEAPFTSLVLCPRFKSRPKASQKKSSKIMLNRIAVGVICARILTVGFLSHDRQDLDFIRLVETQRISSATRIPFPLAIGYEANAAFKAVRVVGYNPLRVRA